MPTISNVNRARVIMDLVKDDQVSDLAAYSSVDLIGGATALKYAQAFWDAYPHPELGRDPTNEELAANYIARLRQLHFEVLKSVRVKSASQTAGDAEAETVRGELETELGLPPEE